MGEKTCEKVVVVLESILPTLPPVPCLLYIRSDTAVFTGSILRARVHQQYLLHWPMEIIFKERVFCLVSSTVWRLSLQFSESSLTYRLEEESWTLTSSVCYQGWFEWSGIDRRRTQWGFVACKTCCDMALQLYSESHIGARTGEKKQGNWIRLFHVLVSVPLPQTMFRWLHTSTFTFYSIPK